MTLNCLTRLRRGLDMPHWHCHASNQQQTTDNKLLCRLQRHSARAFQCTCAQQAHSHRSEIQPKHRCTVSSICPHTNTQVYRSFHLSTYQYTGVPFLPSVHIPIQHSSKRVVTVEDQVSGQETGVHSVTHVS